MGNCRKVVGGKKQGRTIRKESSQVTKMVHRKGKEIAMNLKASRYWAPSKGNPLMKCVSLFSSFVVSVQFSQERKVLAIFWR